MFRRRAGLSLCALLLASCTTYRDVKEIKTVGFSDDLSQGKPSGQIDSDDCVFKVMGYALGGYPEVSRAINNARTGKKSKITDVAYANDSLDQKSLRYVNNVTVEPGGFDAVVIGKTCLEVQGAGYL